mmetsp:Transcript_3520/g.7222  ORF Transcript_3520/g.7222 Transcript_3520/m.7222 type:complete len:286 (-) Transcript_3520:140-997(-)
MTSMRFLQTWLLTRKSLKRLSCIQEMSTIPLLCKSTSCFTTFRARYRATLIRLSFGRVGPTLLCVKWISTRRPHRSRPGSICKSPTSSIARSCSLKSDRHTSRSRTKSPQHLRESSRKATMRAAAFLASKNSQRRKSNRNSAVLTQVVAPYSVWQVWYAGFLGMASSSRASCRSDPCSSSGVSLSTTSRYSSRTPWTSSLMASRSWSVSWFHSRASRASTSSVEAAAESSSASSGSSSSSSSSSSTESVNVPISLSTSPTALSCALHGNSTRIGITFILRCVRYS